MASLDREDLLARTTRVRAELFGSLGATGHGHGSYNAVLWALEGEDPDEVRWNVGLLRLDEGIREVLDGSLAITSVTGVDVASPAIDDLDKPCPQAVHVGLAPDPIHLFGLTKAGVETRSEICRGHAEHPCKPTACRRSQAIGVTPGR